jgi:serine/threonine-protein kinase
MLVPLALMGCSKGSIDPFGNTSSLVPSGITVVAGNGQTGTVGQALLTPPTIRVLTSDVRPVKDITVVFATTSGSVIDGVVRSDANGVAAAGKWILGSAPGQQILTASIPGVATATFVATAVGTQNPVPGDRVVVGLRPYGLAESPGGAVFASQLDGHSVTRVQFGATTPSGVVNVGTVPTDVALTPSGSLALVTNQFDPSLGFVDVAIGQQSSVIPGASTMFRVIVAPDGLRAYVTETGGRLDVVDLGTRRVSTVIPIIQDANGIAFGRGDTLLYLSSMRGNMMSINVRTNAILRTWSIGGTLQDIAVSPDGNTLYVADEGGAIDVMYASTGTLTTRFVTSSGVFGLKLSPDGKSLYATEPAAGKVLVIDRVTGVVSHTFSVDGMPRRVAFDRATGRAIVSNEAGWLDFLPLP